VQALLPASCLHPVVYIYMHIRTSKFHIHHTHTHKQCKHSCLQAVIIQYCGCTCIYKSKRHIYHTHTHTNSASTPACKLSSPSQDCGDVEYPLLRDPLSAGPATFVLGAFHNTFSGLVLPHIGLMKRVRIYDGVLNNDAVSAAAKRLEYNLPDERCREGEFGAYQGFVPCLPCRPGTFSIFEGSSECNPCPIGYVYTCLCTSVCMCVYIWIYIIWHHPCLIGYACVYIYVCIYIYIYTYI
jgi:hypothetical protein